VMGLSRKLANRFLVLVAVMLVASTLQLVAQDVQVTARVDSNNILIGDWIRLHIEARHQEGAQVQFPALADSLQGMEVVRRDSITTQKVNQQVLESITYTLTAFDTGTFVIPPLPVTYYSPGDKTPRSAETLPIPIFVHSVGIVDTSKDIKDIKPPVSLSITFAEMLPYILGVIGIGAVSWLVYYLLKKRKRGETFIPQAPPRPAHEIALEALRALESENMWQRGLMKEYHSQLTDIIRAYIEGRYHVMALEMITDEILIAPAIKTLDPQAREQLRDMLVLADLVKFAKFQPTPEENTRSMRSAHSFVEVTMQHTPVPVRQEVVSEGVAS